MKHIHWYILALAAVLLAGCSKESGGEIIVPDTPQQNGYTNNGYAQQGQYPQQNPYGGQPNNGYYAQGGQQGYPQQTPQNPYGQPVQQQNYNNRPGYGAQQNNNDATVQFNIPRRS